MDSKGAAERGHEENKTLWDAVPLTGKASEQSNDRTEETEKKRRVWMPER